MYFSETKNLIRPFDIYHLSPARMKNSLHFTLLVLLLFTAGSAFAQESGSPSFENYDSENLVERDRMVPSGGSVDPPKSVVRPQRDTAQVKAPKRNVFKPSPVVPIDESKPKQQGDDSILSFNFLYYLIQKYKMQDILE
jgi:hypothetical protein